MTIIISGGGLNFSGGGISIESSAGPSYGSVLLNGTTQYLGLSGQSQFAFGTNPFTIEFFVNLNSFADVPLIIDFRPFSTNGAYVTAGLDSSGNFYFVNNNTIVVTASTAITTNTWNHLVACRTGGITTLYVNGVAAGSVSDAVNYLIGAGSPLIGVNAYNPPATTNYFGGYLSNLRIVNGVGVYTGNFTVPTGPLSATQSANPFGGSNTAAITGTETALLLNTYSGAGFLTDGSTNSFTVTNVNGAISSSTAPF